MNPSIDNPLLRVPGAMEALQALAEAPQRCEVAQSTLNLADPPASQINGCSVCLDMHTRELKAAGEPDKRIFTPAAGRETPYITHAERAALALSEAVTPLADSTDPVPEAIWEEAARRYDERELAGPVISIAVIDAFSRVHGATGQAAGERIGRWLDARQGEAKAP